MSFAVFNKTQHTTQSDFRANCIKGNKVFCFNIAPIRLQETSLAVYVVSNLNLHGKDELICPDEQKCLVVMLNSNLAMYKCIPVLC